MFCKRMINLMFVLILAGCTKIPIQEDQKNLVWSSAEDWSGVMSQSFKIGKTGKLKKISIAIEGRENSRELLVIVRKADIDGYPKGAVISSGTDIIVPTMQHSVIWADINLFPSVNVSKNEILTFSLIAAKPVEKYGYFQYAYSLENAYKEGRLFRDYSRRDNDDQGLDFCFKTFVK